MDRANIKAKAMQIVIATHNLTPKNGVGSESLRLTDEKINVMNDDLMEWSMNLTVIMYEANFAA